jgi:hypothetical protein
MLLEDNNRRLWLRKVDNSNNNSNLSKVRIKHHNNILCREAKWAKLVINKFQDNNQLFINKLLQEYNLSKCCKVKSFLPSNLDK